MDIFGIAILDYPRSTVGRIKYKISDIMFSKMNQLIEEDRLVSDDYFQV